MDFMKMTRIPYAFTQTLFIALGFLHAGGLDIKLLALGMLALSPLMAYGGVYILNDLADREHDRAHPKKRDRAIASGRIAKGKALVLALTLMLAGLALSLYLGFWFAVITAIVIANNLAYSFRPRFKDSLFLGLLSCSLNYPLRFLAGVSLAQTSVSGLLQAALLFLIALHGFSAYRIYDIKSKSPGKTFRSECKLTAVIRATALTAAGITLAIHYAKMPALALAMSAYMLLFSEINLRIVKRGIDFFQLLRPWKAAREKNWFACFPFMVCILAVIVFYAIVKS